MARVTFPFNVRHISHSAKLVGLSDAPQSALSGAMSVQPRLGGHWQATASFWATNEATALALQAFVAQMEGMLGTTLFPMYQRYAPLDAQGRRATGYGIGALGNGDIWEGTGSQTWEHYGFESEPSVTATLAASAALRATELRVTNSNTLGLRPGQMFGLGERTYWAKSVWQSGAQDVVSITPPLRAAAAAGDMLVLDRPTCLMRFASEDESALAFTIEPNVQVTMNMVEAI